MVFQMDHWQVIMIAVLQRQFKALSKDSPGQDCEAMYRLEGRTMLVLSKDDPPRGVEGHSTCIYVRLSKSRGMSGGETH